MTRYIFNFILGLSLLGLSSVGAAFEAYRFVEDGCKAHTGLIVNADAASIHVLTIEGQYTKIARSDIRYVLVYNTVNNPISEIKLSPDLLASLQDVYLSNALKPDILGWPIQFIEELVVIFDLSGKINYIDQEKLVAIKPTQQGHSETIKLKNSKQYSFSFGNNLPDCPKAKGKNQVQPTRILSDKIKINEFLAGYESGFRELNKFRRRTRFYARPFLYERRTRLGFTVTNESYMQELPVDMIPLAITWTSGKTYSHQSSSSLGYKPIEWLPNVEPVFAGRSELKSHFFSASLAGNLFALPMGKSFIYSNRVLFGGYFAGLEPDAVQLIPQFNYMALSGIDYGRHSIAAGIFNPIFGVVADGYFREVLASRSAFMMRYMYQSSDTKLKVLYSTVDLGSNSPDEEHIRVALLSEMAGGSPASLENPLINSMERFEIKSQYLRLGVDYEFSNELTFGLDELWIQAKYNENFLGTDREVSFDQFITASYVKQQFGNYVALRGNVNFFIRNATYEYGSNPKKDEDSQNVSASLTIEFML